jgi:hypothetical protein
MLLLHGPRNFSSSLEIQRFYRFGTQLSLVRGLTVDGSVLAGIPFIY